MFNGRRPADDELSSSYHAELVSRLTGDEILTVLADQMFWLCELAGHLSTDQVDTVHKPYAWTIRQVFVHLNESERVFAFRTQHAAAGDATPLPPFNENAYVDARYGLGPFSNLITELAYTRQSTLMMLRRIKPMSWNHRITVDDQSISTRGLAWVTAGHLAHHLEIVEKRAGLSVQRVPMEKSV